MHATSSELGLPPSLSKCLQIQTPATAPPAVLGSNYVNYDSSHSLPALQLELLA